MTARRAPLGLGALAAAALTVIPARADERAYLLASNDNDFWAFQGQDVGYSNGLEVDVRLPVGPWPGAARWLAGGSLGQAMFTPGNLREARAEALRMDHPYIGWLWVTGRLDAFADRLRLLAEVRAGLVGPHAFAEQTQTAWHSWNRAPRPRGWRVLQVGDAPDLALRSGVSADALRIDAARARAGRLGLRATAEASCEAGALRLRCQGAAWVRVGLLRAEGAAPLLEAPVAPPFVQADGRRPREVFVFAGVAAQRGWRDRMLEGDVCDDDGRCEPSWVRARPWVTGWQLGLAATASGWSLSFAYARRSPALDAPPPLVRSQSYGRLTLGAAW